MTDEKAPDVSEEIKDKQENVGLESSDASEAQVAQENVGPEGSDASEAQVAQENAGPEGSDASEAQVAQENVKMTSPEDQPADTPAEGEADAAEQKSDADMLKMLEDLPEEGSGAKPEDINFEGTGVSDAEFLQLSHPAGQPDARNIDMLMDVNLPVSIELGRTRMAITDILALGPGSVVELNKLAGEPVDVMVNGKAVAKGEVVVIDENFGVRVTQLLTAEERLRSLGDEL